MITFGSFKNSGTAKRMSGICTDSPDFLSYTNGAIDQLLRRGKWWGTFRSIKSCTYGGCVTWPRHVQTVLAVRGCHGLLQNFNQWYRFLPMQSCGYFYRDWAGWGKPSLASMGFAIGSNTSPVFNNIPFGGDCFLQIYCGNANDAGKFITICGIDSNNQRVQQQRPDGTFQDGVRIQLAVPFVTTPIQFRKVTRVNKDLTLSPVRIFQVSPLAGGLLLPMAYYEPSETHPEYIQTALPGGLCQNCQPNVAPNPQPVEALVKIKFTPIMYDDDVMLIDNEAAVANMIFAQREKEAGNISNARAYEGDAFRELNFQMKDYFPDEQFVVSFQPFGHDDGLNRDNIRIGML